MTSSCGLRSSTCGTARISMRSSPDTAPKLRCDARVFWRDPRYNASLLLALRRQDAGCFSHRSTMLVIPFSKKKEDSIACTHYYLRTAICWQIACKMQAPISCVDARDAHSL